MTIQEQLEQMIQNGIEGQVPFHEYAFITPSQLVFEDEVRHSCEKNYCGRYGKCWTCPPGCGPISERKAHILTFKKAFVFTTKHNLEDSFDVEGMDEARVLHEKLENAILKMLNNPQVEVNGAGSCSICPTCAYPNEPCRHPDLARVSIEACGISVVTLAKDLGIHYINGVNTVTYFSILYYSE